MATRQLGSDYTQVCKLRLQRKRTKREHGEFDRCASEVLGKTRTAADCVARVETSMGHVHDIAIESEQFSDKRKTALLLHSLGTEGQRRYSKLKELTFYPPSATEFEKTNLKLENEYRIIRNKRAERYTFRKRTQTQHESITEYIAALRDLTSTCDFGDFLDDAICDQLIEKMNNHTIRERLLADENIDLDKAIVVAVRLESAIKHARSMEAQNSVNPFSTESVNVVR